MLFYLTIGTQIFDKLRLLIAQILQINHFHRYKSSVSAIYGRLKIRFTPP